MTVRSLTQNLLPWAVFFYTLALFLASSTESLSKLVHLGMVPILALLLYKSWAEGLTFRREPLLIVTWLFFIFAAFSVFWAVNQRTAMVSVGSLFFDVFGATLVWLALWNGASVRAVGYAAALGATVQALIALNQFYTLRLTEDETFRAEGLVGNANGLATQLSLAAFILLLSLGKQPWARALAILLAVVATVVSGSRTMIFVWVTFLLLALQYFGLKVRTSLLFTGLFLVSLPVFTIVLLNNSERLLAPIENIYLYERLQQALEGREGSANTRLRMIQEGLSLWRDAPVIGYGINQFRWVGSFTTYSHSNYTELLVSFGVIGFLLYHALLLGILLRGGLGAALRQPRAWLVIASVILILLFGISVVYYQSRLMWLFIAVLSHVSASLLGEAAQQAAGEPHKTRPARRRVLA